MRAGGAFAEPAAVLLGDSAAAGWGFDPVGYLEGGAWAREGLGSGGVFGVGGGDGEEGDVQFDVGFVAAAFLFGLWEEERVSGG